MTSVKGQTDSDGRIRFQAFYGDYVMRYPLSPSNTAGVHFRIDPADSGTIRLSAPFAKHA
jgi:hypothetical protein